MIVVIQINEGCFPRRRKIWSLGYVFVRLKSEFYYSLGNRCEEAAQSKKMFRNCSLFLIATIALIWIERACGEVVVQSIYEFPTSVYGASPRNSLLEGAPGTFYGTSFYGGATSNGSIYKVTSSGILTYLHSFNGFDGWLPWGGLVWGDDGFLYGVARNHVTSELGIGDGIIFKCTTNGDFSVVFTFSGTNGSKPTGPLAKADDGSFYGTTAWGGGIGNVFRVSTNGTLNVISWFDARSQGANPFNGLVKSHDGCFYGITEVGGTNEVGVLFKVCNDQLIKVVDFGPDVGEYPVGCLTIGNDFNLYGVTVRGYNFGEKGTVYRVDTNGLFSIVGTFEGEGPMGGVTQARDGNLYGAMSYGGFLFRMSTSGVFTRLNYLPAVYPMIFFTAASDGNLYGGLSDYQDPFHVPPGIILRLVEPPVITSFAISNHAVSLNWNSFTGGVYHVEYKPSLESSNWVPRSPAITATQAVSSFTDSAATRIGYYRIVLLP